LKPEFVEGIAQGRVWSGTEAKKLGLVDDMGGLTAAISYAAKQVNLGTDFRLIEYPKKKNLAEAIQELIGKGVPEATAAVTHAGLIGQIERRIETELKQLDVLNDPQGVYALLPLHLSVN